MDSPATPPTASSSRSSPSNISEGDSLLNELSFDYVWDNEGKFQRVSKGSSKSPSSTPPTPPADPDPPASSTIASSTLATTSVRRVSLSRSESMPSELLAVPTRPLTRATSGPITTGAAMTPAQPARSVAPLSVGLSGRKIGGPQRVRKEEAERQRLEIAEKIRREEQEAERERLRKAMEEKENAQIERHSPPQVHARPIASLPARSTTSTLTRIGRTLFPGKKGSTITKINEVETSEGENEEGAYGSNVNSQSQRLQQSSAYPLSRRSPSEILPDSLALREPVSYNITSQMQHQESLAVSRPSSSLGFAGGQTRRSMLLEERLRQERITSEELQDRSHPADVVATESCSLPNQSPSPTQVSAQSQHPHARVERHQRRDSDTLRMAAIQRTLREEANQDQPQYVEFQTSSRSVGSTTLVNSGAGLQQRHRRSPTAPEAPTTSGALQPHSNNRENLKTWSNGDKNVDQEDEYQEPYVKPDGIVPSYSGPRAQVQAPPVHDIRLNRQNYTVNKKSYARLDLLGKGGSSRVYRVMTGSNEIYALKKVSLDRTDQETISGYINEMNLLKRLDGNKRIIRLIDSEVKNSAGAKGQLMLVMECGETDFNRLLQERQGEPLNMVWVAYYWQQMLQAVQVIHDEKIVHSDLKPANFVLVKGQLKLIDFGIANAIANDTTNIHREAQIGTLNYMSPEAIETPDGVNRHKLGRASDVWSLGCILYQMVYGHPPFYHLPQSMLKMKAITNASHTIDFPEISIPTEPVSRKTQDATPSPPKKLTHLGRTVRQDVIRTMRKCLCRQPKERATIPQLLNDDWLEMREPKLKDDEAIITPYYMRQLLEHAIRQARSGSRDNMSEEDLEAEAKNLVQELKQISASDR